MSEIISLKNGIQVEVDIEKDKGECRGCGEEIFWATTRRGKKMPICQEDDGSWVSHFSNCIMANDFRKKK